MFGLFQPKPPLSPWEKAWVEDRMCGFAQQLGIARLVETPTLTPDYAGIPSVQKPEDLPELVNFLQTWMKVDADHVEAQIFSDSVAPERLTLPNRERANILVKIPERDLGDQVAVVARIARELSRATLTQTDSTQNATSSIDEWTIELLPAYLGLAIFGANSATTESNYSTGTMSWWSVRQRGQLPARMFGYAMALRSSVRAESTAEWSHVLRQDARCALDDGVLFLTKTGDSIFAADAEKRPRGELPVDALLDELKNGSPSRKISAIWELEKRRHAGEPNPRVPELLMDALRSKHSDVRAVAVTALPLFDRSEHAAQDISDSLHDPSEEVRIAAAAALAEFPGVDDETLVHDLTNALKDDVRLVVFNAARSLTHYGQAAEPATKMLLKRLRRTMVECRDDDAITMMWALDAILDDAPTTIATFFEESDSDFRGRANELFQQLDSYSRSA